MDTTVGVLDVTLRDIRESECLWQLTGCRNGDGGNIGLVDRTIIVIYE